MFQSGVTRASTIIVQATVQLNKHSTISLITEDI